VWTRLVGTSQTDEAFSVAATPSGFVVAGITSVTGGNEDLLVIKLNSNGNIIWQKTYGGSESESNAAVAVALDGSIYLSAYTRSNNSGDVGTNHGAKDFLVLKLNANGDKLWSRTLGGDQDDLPGSITRTSDGGCIVAGYTNSSGNGDVGVWYGGQSMWVVKLNADGNLIWTRMFGGSQRDGVLSPAALIATVDGDYVLAGYSGSSNGDLKTNQGGSDFWVLKINSNGNKVWSKTYGGSDNDYVNAVSMNGDGSIWVAGITESNNTGDVGSNHGYSDGWVLKIKE
jgi:hypothetical protein